MERQRPEAVATFERKTEYDLVDFDKLPRDEQQAVIEAAISYSESENTDFRVGAAALASDGSRFRSNNNAPGQAGHGEQQALTGLFGEITTATNAIKLAVPEAGLRRKRIVAIALVASRPNEDALRDYARPHEKGKVTMEDVDWEGICGHCRKFINDYTAGDNNPEEIIVLVATTTGQVMRTTLSTLYPFPHRVTRMPLDPIKHPAGKDFFEQEIAKLPPELQQEVRKLPVFNFDDPRGEHKQRRIHGEYDTPK